MPSITKSVSFILLAGAATNVLGAPSAPSRRTDLISSLGLGGGAKNPIGSPFTQITDAVGDVVDTVVDTTSDVADSVGSTNTDLFCTLVTPSGLKVALDGIYQLLASNGQELPGCSTKQVKQCADKETQDEKDNAMITCPALKTCKPEEISEVWKKCMINKCKNDPKCLCNKCENDGDSPMPPTCTKNCDKPPTCMKNCDKTCESECSKPPTCTTCTKTCSGECDEDEDKGNVVSAGINVNAHYSS